MKIIKIRALLSLLFCLGSFTTLYAKDYIVTDFGAKGDGKTNNTAAIQKAIDKASQNGGTVVIPEGIYISGTLKLKSNITLEIQRNAILKGITDRAAYPSLPIESPMLTSSGQWGHALIYASKLENIAITGEGTIDGNGGDPIFDTKQNENVMRPFVLLVVGCKNVKVSGLNLRNSAMWMQRYIACDFLRIAGINVFNHCNANNDGLDIDDCHEVIVSDCVIDADDDALCFKSEGERGVKNAVVTNCILASHASAFKMGTGSVGGFQSIQFSNTVIRQSRATNLVHIFRQKSGLTGIDLASTDGAVLKDVNISNVSIDSLETPIFLRLGNRMGRKTAPRPGVFEDVHFSQITIKNAGPITSAITGFPGTYIKDVSFRDIFIEHLGGGAARDTSLQVPENSNQYPGSRMFSKKRLPATAFYVRHVKNIQFNNVRVKLINADVRPALVLDDVEDAEIAGLKYPAAATTPTQVIVANSKDISINGNLKEGETLKSIKSSGIKINR